MSITFNADVTIYGNVEMYSNGSMKITTSEPINIPITELKNFIERNLKDSSNKENYLSAADDLEKSNDIKTIQKAIRKIKDVGKDIGRSILISGLSNIVIDAIKGL